MRRSIAQTPHERSTPSALSGMPSNNDSRTCERPTKAYGPANGFGWKLNEIIGAQVVTVPMSVPFSMAKSAFGTLMASLVGVFALTLIALNLLLNYTVIRPLRRLAQMADDVSLGNLEAPEAQVVGKDEVGVLAGSLNRMRLSMIKAMKMLEDEER